MGEPEEEPEVPEEVPEERKFSFVYIPVKPCVPG